MNDRIKFRAKELAIILSHYDLGTISEIHSYRRGNPHSPKAVISSEKGKFFLKRRAPGRDDPARVALAHELQIFLAHQGFHVPRLVIPLHGQSSMLQAYSFIYEMFEFIPGDGYDASDIATRRAGEVLRAFHRRLEGHQSPHTIPQGGYHDCPGIRRNIQMAFEKLKNDTAYGPAQERESLAETMSQAYADACARVRLEGPAVICHGDWHPANLIFRQQQVVSVLDFDSVHYLHPLGDVATGCLQFSMLVRGRNPADWPDFPDIPRARSFLQGYREGAWPRAELENVINLMIEALIAESVTPIAATGMFANVQGLDFLRMIARKVRWLQEQAVEALS